MPKQTLFQRLSRAFKDCTEKGADPAKRWEAIVEDLPEEVAALNVPGVFDARMPEVTLDDVPIEEVIPYAGRDADATYRLAPLLSRRIDDMGLREVYEMDLAIIPMVERMQRVGMRVDVGHFGELAAYFQELMKLKIAELNEVTEGKTGPDFNPGSPKQTAELLFGTLGITAPKKTREGMDSTNDKVLQSLAVRYPACRVISDWRELSKLCNSFALVMPTHVDASSRVHPNFRITRVATGRLSCTDPNLLAIPVRSDLGKLIRCGFKADVGRTLGSWDLNQIEMREMAHQSQDEALLSWYADGLDVHQMTAAEIFGKQPELVSSFERFCGKTVGFGIIMGMTEIGLAWTLAQAGAEGWDSETCNQFIQQYFAVHPGVWTYQQDCRAEARRYNYVRDRWGRIRYLPGIHSKLPFVREEAERQSHAFKISSSAQGVMKHAMHAIWDWWKSEGWAVGEPMTDVEPQLQIHDELVCDVKDDEGLKLYLDAGMIHFLCNTTLMRVPILAKGGFAQDWGGLKD